MEEEVEIISLPNDDVISGGELIVTVDNGIGKTVSVDSLQTHILRDVAMEGIMNANTRSPEPQRLSLWTGTEAQFQSLVALDIVDPSIIYHRR